MTSRRARRITWLLWAVTLVSVATGLSLSLAGGIGVAAVADSIWSPLALATLGALLSVRVPHNPIGWILLGVGVSDGLGAAAAGYADLTLLGGVGSTALGEVAAWVSMWLFAPVTLVPLTFVLLLFPEGSFGSRSARVIAGLSAVGIAGMAAFIALHPGGTDASRWGPNPFGVSEGSPLLPMFGVAMVLVVPGLLGAAATLAARFRRTAGAERQQLKWVAYAAALAVPLLLVAGTLFDETLAGKIGTSVAFALIPGSITVAILRYRLYDIDRIVSRTLAYALLSGVLVALYLVAVLGLSRLLAPFAAGSDLAVAAATLAAAAAAQPVRVRIQGAVDRRFYRSRYDAHRTLEAFATRLRDEVDLDALSDEVLTVVSETIQPRHASLWLAGKTR